MSKITRILPFIAKEETKELAMKIINKEIDGIKLIHVFPFLRETDLNEIVELLIEKDDGYNLKHAIPFISEEKVDEIMKKVVDGSITNLEEHYLYPFLSKDQIKVLFDEMVKKAASEKESETEDQE